MEEFLNQVPVLFGSLAIGYSEPYWRPPADIYRTKTGWLIKYDLAGVSTRDIEITIAGATVTLDGCRRDSNLEDGCSHYAMEISYSRFARSIQLPSDLERAQCKIQWRDGILLLRLLCQGEPS